MYSPAGWYSWGDAAQQFVAANKHESLLKVWVNTMLGETWVDRGETSDWERLVVRREPYKIGTVPQGGLVLTAGVDVQQDRKWSRGGVSVKAGRWTIRYYWAVRNKTMCGSNSIHGSRRFTAVPMG